MNRHESSVLTPESSRDHYNLFIKALRVCLDRRLSFALFSLPDSQDIRLMGMPPETPADMTAFPVDEDDCQYIDRDTDCFFIGRFADADEPMAGVRDMLSLEELAANPWPESEIDDEFREYNYHFLGQEGDPFIKPQPFSTTRHLYSEAFREARKFATHVNGKVVLSRIVAEKINGSIIDQYVKLFKRFPNCFRYLCYTPQTGFWIGATPELLLEVNADAPYEFLTYSLAGTLPADSDETWDDKNIREQALVTDFIKDALRAVGVEPEIGPVNELKLPTVRHLLTTIKGHGSASALDVLCALNPTPATLGFPREEALELLDFIEPHSRHCYAGAIGVCLASRLYAYANLRCAFAERDMSSPCSAWLYNFYAGSGILPDSDEGSEWKETEMKALSLRSLFQEPVDEKLSIADAPELPF